MGFRLGTSNDCYLVLTHISLISPMSLISLSLLPLAARLVGVQLLHRPLQPRITLLLPGLRADYLPDHLYLFQRISQLIGLVVFLYQLFLPVLVLLALWEPHEVVLLNRGLLPEFALYLLGHHVLHTLLASLVVVDDVVSEPADEVHLSSLFLDLLAATHLVLLGQDC